MRWSRVGANLARGRISRAATSRWISKAILTARGSCANARLLLVAKADAMSLGQSPACARRGRSASSISRSFSTAGVSINLLLVTPTLARPGLLLCGYAFPARLWLGRANGGCAGWHHGVVRAWWPARGRSSLWWPRVGVPHGRPAWSASSQFSPTLRPVSASGRATRWNGPLTSDARTSLLEVTCRPSPVDRPFSDRPPRAPKRRTSHAGPKRGPPPMPASQAHCPPQQKPGRKLLTSPYSPCRAIRLGTGSNFDRVENCDFSTSSAVRGAAHAGRAPSDIASPLGDEQGSSAVTQRRGVR